jgi:hypothetical protein
LRLRNKHRAKNHQKQHISHAFYLSFLHAFFGKTPGIVLPFPTLETGFPLAR